MNIRSTGIKGLRPAPLLSVLSDPGGVSNLQGFRPQNRRPQATLHTREIERKRTLCSGIFRNVEGVCPVSRGCLFLSGVGGSNFVHRFMCEANAVEGSFWVLPQGNISILFWATRPVARPAPVTQLHTGSSRACSSNRLSQSTSRCEESFGRASRQTMRKQACISCS